MRELSFNFHKTVNVIVHLAILNMHQINKYSNYVNFNKSLVNSKTGDFTCTVDVNSELISSYPTLVHILISILIL